MKSSKPLILTTLVFTVLMLTAMSCAGPKVVLRPGVPIETIGINVDFMPGIPMKVRDGFDRSLNDFIMKHNASNQAGFKVKRAQVGCTACLTIRVIETRLVRPGQQTAGVIVSLIGFSLPVAMASAGSPFVLWFYYFPRANSFTELSLSDDINGAPAPVTPFVLHSPGFLKSPERQVEKHVVYFDKFLTALFDNISAQYKKHRPVRQSISAR